MSQWQEFIFPVLNLPMKPGVYAIYVNGHLFYIGQTVNLRNRFNEHNIRYGYAANIILPWLRVANTTNITVKISLSRKYGDWAMRELRLIKRLKPPANRKGIRKKENIDLVRLVASAK